MPNNSYSRSFIYKACLFAQLLLIDSRFTDNVDGVKATNLIHTNLMRHVGTTNVFEWIRARGQSFNGSDQVKILMDGRGSLSI